MTDDTTPTEAPTDGDAIDVEDTPTEADPEPAVEEEQESPNAEAAKWRRQLRETEGQLTDMTARLEALQRQQIETQVTAAGVKPAALWKTSELASLIADDGTVDAELVAAAIATAREELGITPLGKGTHVPGVGNHPNTRPKTDAWAEAFKPKAKR